MDKTDDKRDPSASTKSILVVADIDLNEMLFDHLLRQEWTVEYASSNHEACSLCSRKPFDLIITAEGTSAVEDIGLLRRIRKVRPHTHMIILTHESTTQDVILALRDGAFSYFSPPYTFESLRQMIHLAMEEPCWDDGIEVA